MKSNKLIMFLVFSVILCISMLGSASAAGNNSTGLANSPYPTFQVDNRHTGQSNYTGPQTNTTKWTYTAGTGTTAVIGSDGLIYVSYMQSLDIKALYSNGTEKWKTTLPSTISNNNPRGLTIGNNGTLYITAYKSLYALNTSNGEIQWNYDYTTTPINTSIYPTIGSDGTIYFGTTAASPTFYAINPDGTEKWKYTLTGYAKNWAIGSDGTVYLRTSSMVYAFDPANGNSPKWSINFTGSDKLSIGNNGSIYISSNNILYALNPVDGSIQRSYTASNNFVGSPAIAADGTIYIASIGAFLALTDDGTNLTVKWTYNDSQIQSATSNRFGIIIGADGIIYTTNGLGAGAGTKYGSIYALTPNGNLIWSYSNLGNTAQYGMIGSDGTLYVVSNAGILWAFQDFVADFTTNVSNGLSVNFTDNSSNLPVTWVWDFGDGNSSDQQNPTHTYSNSGTYDVTLLVISANGDSTSVMKSVKVSQAPTLNPVGDKSVAANETLSFTVSGSDLDGDSLTYSATGLPSGATFDPATGVFSWTPTAGQVGSYVVTFSVSDGVSTVSQDVNIVVGKANTAPTLDPVEDKIVDENQSLNFNLNGQDADSDSLSYSATGLPAGATLDPNTGAFSWTPGYSQSGTYHVTFMVSDGKLTDSKTMTINVNNVNQAPVLNSVEDKSVNENQSLNFMVSGSDVDGDSLTYSATGLPSGATFDPATGAFSWTPGYSQAGTYTVTFTVSDGSLTDSKTMKITVNNVNRAPTIGCVSDKTVDENKKLTFSVCGDDLDGDSLTFSATGLPSGAVFNSKTGVFSWVPGYSQAGVYPVTFTVSDGKLTVSKTMKITVNNVDNVAPTVSKIDPVNYAVVNNARKVITVTFSEVVKRSAGLVTLKNSKGAVVSSKVAVNGNRLTITPTKALANGLYTVLLSNGSVTDTTGNKLAAYTSKFTVDTVAPKVTRIDPARYATIKSTRKVITVTFSEAVKEEYWFGCA